MIPIRNSGVSAAYILSIIGITVALAACSGTRPSHLGGIQSSLNPCPSSPNCVSSLASEDEEHYIKPLEIDDMAEANATLVDIITGHASARIIVKDPGYIYAEYESEIMGFVDDLELLFTPEKVYVRSASRIGRSDFGVNRERVESLRTALRK